MYHLQNTIKANIPKVGKMTGWRMISFKTKKKSILKVFKSHILFCYEYCMMLTAPFKAGGITLLVMINNLDHWDEILVI